MIHPGQILRENFFTTTEQALDFIKWSKIDPNIYSNIIQEKQSINKDVAKKLARYFDTSEDYWLDLQLKFDNNKYII